MERKFAANILVLNLERQMMIMVTLGLQAEIPALPLQFSYNF